MAIETPKIKLNYRHWHYFLKPVTLGFILLFLSATAAYSQNCPPASSSSFMFEPEFLGDTTTVIINLAPCETLEVRESHDMLGDGNRGTLVMVTYLNSSNQPIYTQNIYGFYAATDILVPSSYSEPFPWVGIRSDLVQPASIKVESWCCYGRGNPPIIPRYNFTVIRSPRPNYNIGGDSFGNAPLVPSFPTTYRGSVRDATITPPADPGQFFKVHLNPGQSIYASGTVTQNTFYGTNFVLDIYDANQQLVTTPTHWLFTATYEVDNYTTQVFTNPNPTPADFYIRAWSDNWPTRDFSLTIHSPSQTCACPDIPVVP